MDCGYRSLDANCKAVNLPELTKAEQMLLWGQGQVNLDHPKATVVLTIAEAKSSGYDWATILNI